MDDGTTLVRVDTLAYAQAAQAVQDLSPQATPEEWERTARLCLLAIVSAKREQATQEPT